MKVLAVTCYTGGKSLAEMTGRCVHGLLECVPEGVELQTSVLGQGVDHAPWAFGGKTRINTLRFNRRNVGFAAGMNTAIEEGLDQCVESDAEIDHVLCFNNDLEFPRKNWLRHLTDIAEQAPNQIIVPATDSAAIRVQPGPEGKASYPVEENSAYCWLVPFAWCKWLKKTHGFWLFDEDFAPCYGEDNWTAFLLSKQFGPKVFRYVPRSFVKHLRARTSRIVDHDRKRSNQVLVDKFNTELKDPTLRPDLRRWATRYVNILSKRI